MQCTHLKSFHRQARPTFNALRLAKECIIPQEGLSTWQVDTSAQNIKAKVLEGYMVRAAVDKNLVEQFNKCALPVPHRNTSTTQPWLHHKFSGLVVTSRETEMPRTVTDGNIATYSEIRLARAFRVHFGR